MKNKKINILLISVFTLLLIVFVIFLNIDTVKEFFNSEEDVENPFIFDPYIDIEGHYENFIPGEDANELNDYSKNIEFIEENQEKFERNLYDEEGYISIEHTYNEQSIMYDTLIQVDLDEQAGKLSLENIDNKDIEILRPYSSIGDGIVHIYKMGFEIEEYYAELFENGERWENIYEDGKIPRNQNDPLVIKSGESYNFDLSRIIEMLNEDGVYLIHIAFETRYHREDTRINMGILINDGQKEFFKVHFLQDALDLWEELFKPDIEIGEEEPQRAE